MAHRPEINASLQERVNDYLRTHSAANNSFVRAAETAHSVEGELNEYLLKRAEEELRKAQARVEELRQKIAGQGRANAAT